MKRQPIQPMEWVDGVLRFKANPIVDFMVEELRRRGFDLNALHAAHIKATNSDWDQFNMLIGYSVSGCPIRDELTGYRVGTRRDEFLDKFPKPTLEAKK